MKDKELVEKLKEKGISTIINSLEYRELLKTLAKDIRETSKDAPNETSVFSSFEIQLFNFINNTLGLRFSPDKETTVNTERRIAKGRMDSKIGALIIDFKHCSKLSTATLQNCASEQIIDYLKGLHVKHPFGYLGVITDGMIVKFVRFENEAIIEESFEQLTYRHLDRLVKSIILMEQKALTSENLVKDFCSPDDDSIALHLVKDLYKSLQESASQKTAMLFGEWKQLFRLAHDDSTKQKANEERRKSLGEVIGHRIVDNEDEYRVLFSLQTAYAIIMKVIAFSVISKIRFEFNSLIQAETEMLRVYMDKMEDGLIFRDLGIRNLLEGDFFSWYASIDQWNDDIADEIRKVCAILSKYEDKSLLDKGNKIQDLFKDFYMTLMPEKVRHSLGEYYTTSWLANSVLEDALALINRKEGWRGIDPCAGSGTFVITMIRKVLEETEALPNQERLKAVLERVKAIDLNPLAVLTARINYFINISHLLGNKYTLEIPVYLGDASNVPKLIDVDGFPCLSYTIGTAKGIIEIVIPKSALQDFDAFSDIMYRIELDIKGQDAEAALQKLLSIIEIEEQTKEVIHALSSLCNTLVELEEKEWNGIWVRIIANFLKTANLGEFDIIIGNPPWIDWKNLPEGYRDRIKSLCIARHLFSGDRRTGGINLNICALISNVTAQNWLSKEGTLGFLMPQTLLFQQSYEGFRNFILDNNEKLYFQKFVDWTKSGHPFKPVTEKFLTYFVGYKEVHYAKGVHSTGYKIKKGYILDDYRNTLKFEDMNHIFQQEEFVVGQCDELSTKFTHAGEVKDLLNFHMISGECPYKGREGIEFYPQELFLLEIDKDAAFGIGNDDPLFVRNYQNSKSKYSIPRQTVAMEKEFLHPLIKGTNISRFHIEEPEFIVPFPYNNENPKIPIKMGELMNKSPLLADYFNRNKSIILSQTSYNEKIIGDTNAEFYALARVGKYSFAHYHVVFRDNTKWVAAVSSPYETDWGGVRRPLFQNHAVSICENAQGEFISEDEAHYICAILNAPIVQEYMLNSSDSRSFKIRPPIKMAAFEKGNPIHQKLVELSKKAHQNYKNKQEMAKIDDKLDQYYLESLKELR